MEKFAKYFDKSSKRLFFIKISLYEEGLHNRCLGKGDVSAQNSVEF